MLALLTNLSGKADFQDSLQSVQDTVAVASDSTGTVAGAGEEMGRAVDLLASGDIYSFSQQMKVIFIKNYKKTQNFWRFTIKFLQVHLPMMISKLRWVFCTNIFQQLTKF